MIYYRLYESSASKMFAFHYRQFVWNVWLEILTLDQVLFLYVSFSLSVMTQFLHITCTPEV